MSITGAKFSGDPLYSDGNGIRDGNGMSYGARLLCKRLFFCKLFLLLSISLIIAPIVFSLEAPPGIPIEFWGEINTSDGLPVTIEFNGTEFGQGATTNGFYSVIVPMDNPLTFLEDPTCLSNSPCIPCSTDPIAEDYCLEGPTNGSVVDLKVDGKTTNTSVVFSEDAGGEKVDVSLSFKVILALASGFNLISVPVSLSSWELAENPFVMEPANCLTTIYRYNATEGRYQAALFDSEFGWGSGQGFTTLHPGRGYWLRANGVCNITITGKQASSQDIGLQQGFNLVGFFSHRQKALLNSSIPTNDTGCISSLFRYNTQTRLYESAFYSTELGWASSTGLDELEPGRGYWLKTAKSCLWNHNP
ncbi:hypothetical protein HYU13_04740 [Candidatus Woesearchaeota archaeon]|nr:hypothetical protein [Candidatus Woesearchaeota archaeon]